MKLDEVEKAARLIEKYGVSNDAVIMARAVLAMLPVVRAAERWRNPQCSAGGWGCDGCEHCRAAHNQLLNAVDAMRAEMEKP